MKNIFIFIIIISIFISCIGGGTHGYIRRYRYNISKYSLQDAVNKTLIANGKIIRDSVKDYYNNDTSYVTINVLVKDVWYEYTLHFYGGKEYWDTCKTSAISIVYAYNERHEGGSRGGKIMGYKPKIFNDLIFSFEKEIISKLDSALNMVHVEE